MHWISCGSPRFTRKLYIWNPATREIRELPEFPCEDYTDISGVGFGFDPKDNDFKAVAISYFSYEDSYTVCVYSLRTDSWRVVEVDSYYETLSGSSSLHVSGRMHWLGSLEGVDLIVSFDVKEEKIMEMAGAKLNPKNYATLYESLGSLGGSLFPCELTTDRESAGCQVWFMKEYGNSETWTKLYYYTSGLIRGRCILPIPLVFLENGKIIMVYFENVILYDPKNHVQKILNILEDSNVVKYNESLVSIKGGRSISNLNHCASSSESSTATTS